MTNSLKDVWRGRTIIIMSLIAPREPFFPVLQARSSVGERFLDTEEVGSSILPVPTMFV
jgi:hypothetical protein